MVAPERGSTAGPGEGRRGAKTAGATPTTGCVTPPGGVGVERRRDINPRRAPSLVFFAGVRRPGLVLSSFFFESVRPRMYRLGKERRVSESVVSSALS